MAADRAGTGSGTRRVLVVDPASSGRDLVAALRTHDGLEVAEYRQERPFEVRRDGQRPSPEPALLDFAQAGQFDWVIAGSESGVTAADWIADHLRLPCNRPEFLWHRRNKVGMVELADSAGLRAPRTSVVTSRAAAARLVAQIESAGQVDVIVKPVGSAGSDSCFICRDADEVEAAVDSVLGASDMFGARNTEAMVQERIHGTQYFVNVVSVGGEHTTTEMFRYGIDEADSRPHIYSAKTIEHAGPVFESAEQYVHELLDVLGVRFGASHTELRLEGGLWTLIEYNGRSMGPTIPADVYLPGRGFSQVTVLAAVIADGPAAAAAAVAAGRPDHCVGWHMPEPTRAGRLAGVRWDEIEDAPSFVGVYGQPAVGSVFSAANRVTTAAAGLLFFSHSSPAQVQHDLDRSRSLERADAYFDLLGLPHGAR